MRLRFLTLFLAAVCLSGPAIAEDTLADKITAAAEAGELPGLHSTVVMLQGAQIAEVYFDGEDESWGLPLGVVAHGPDTLHDLRSVTKSIVSVLYGIALSDGLVPALDQPLVAQFPDYSDLLDGTTREDILVGHAFTMQMGTEWDEDLPYTDPRNSEIAMERAEDRYRFVLDRPMVDMPGTKWNYSGGAVAVVAKLIADGAGMKIDEFAKARLFAPLGIDNFEWVGGADGEPSAASGLRLAARDLAKIGTMLAQDGMYEGAQIVPVDWIAEMFTPRLSLEFGFDYGYLWYLAGPPDRFVAVGLGNGGQRLTIQSNAQFVTASFAGRYNDPDAWEVSYKVLSDFAVPEAKARRSK